MIPAKGTQLVGRRCKCWHLSDSPGCGLRTQKGLKASSDLCMQLCEGFGFIHMGLRGFMSDLG